jgi:phosphoglycerol transferase MdoB-like AlkP superfamily enzyme
MNNEAIGAKPTSWRRSRLGFAAFMVASMMVGWFVLRLVLFFAFGDSPAPSASDAVLAFLSGLWRDFVVAVWFTLPLLAWLLLAPQSLFQAKWHRYFFWTAGVLFWSLQIFLLFVEYFFFEEFRSRFNTVAVDYLQYPQEVFINIWDSYHVGFVLAICLALAALWVFVASRMFSAMWNQPLGFRRRRLTLLTASAALVFAVAPLLAIAASLIWAAHLPVRIRGAHVSDNRTLNEVANNGGLAFLAAALTHNLDYGAFYKTLPRSEAYQRTRRLLSEPGAQFAKDEGASIRRHISGDSARPRLNVILFLEESFGSEFWGCLGRTNSLTPEMDKLAATEGMLFTNIYASGNRTVRGMEGVLSSFPPLPGESIVKRDRSDNVEALARIFKRDGYSTLFLYGGRGVFDGMRSFAVRNGYERFIEQKHFLNPTFTTIWGVCDEDLYERTIEECRVLAQGTNAFFATVLSVSNHKPFTYPRGKIAENPDERKRENAVKYSDYALGRFFDAARKEPFWTNTIFVVVADHGARVYGNQTIPIFSYEIPLLIAGPAVVKGPSRIGQLGCSLDVGPTILGLIGRPYESLFFGRDLMKCPIDQGRAFLNHNRDVGMLAGDRLVVLGLRQTVEFYGGNPKKVEMKLLAHPMESDQVLEQDAAAIFQVADDLYMHQRYRIDK